MADLTAILERVQERVGPLSGEPTPLEGGITNRNFKASLGGRDYVIRLPGKDTDLLGISRDAERIANEAAARLGIAPALAAADREFLVTEYLEARPLAPPELAPHVEAVAVALRRFHACHARVPARFWVPELLDDYARIIAERGGSLPSEYDPTRTIARRIADALPLTDPRPCHDDLLPSNILLSGGRIVLVDWEYAGMGHPLFDLGNVAVNNELDDAAEDRLLAAYFEQPPTDAQRAALKLMKIMSDAREAAWGAIQGVISELDVDFDAYARKHFDRLGRAADDPRMEDWLGAAAA